MPKVIDWLYTWLPRICGCHCRPDRSFHWHGRPFPVCARCTGELLGILLGIPGCILLGIHPWVSLVMLIPMVIDGFVQLKTRYESNNKRRLWTGLLFGYGFYSLLAWEMVFAFHLGQSLAH